MSQFIFMGVLMAAALGYTVWITRKRKAGMPAAFRMFFERTGYRYADIADKPLDAHIMHGENLMASARNGYHIHMIRDYHGLPVHSVQDLGYRQQGLSTVTTMSASWWAPLPQPPRIYLQIAERSLTGIGKSIKEAFSSTERVWQAMYPLQIASGDPELDRRFLFFGYDAGAVAHALQAPGLRDMLLACAEVDLAVHQDRVLFADPLQKNMLAGMGDTIDQMRLGADMNRTMELTIPVHDRMAHILSTTARQCL
jgi:hypothetical protein